MSGMPTIFLEDRYHRAHVTGSWGGTSSPMTTGVAASGASVKATAWLDSLRLPARRWGTPRGRTPCSSWAKNYNRTEGVRRRYTRLSSQSGEVMYAPDPAEAVEVLDR